jgi:hypothetical protein
MGEYVGLAVYAACGLYGIWRLSEMRDVSLLDCLMMLMCGPFAAIIFIARWAYGLTVLKRRGRH